MARQRWTGLAALALALTIMAAPPLRAGSLDAKAVQVAAKAIGFARPPAPAGAKIAVVGTAAQMSDVQSALGAFSVSAGDGTGSFAAFVPSAAEAKAAGPKVLTIGPPDCAAAGACVIGIDTSGKVTIFLSNAAAAAAGIDFDPNFKLMVTAK